MFNFAYRLISLWLFLDKKTMICRNRILKAVRLAIKDKESTQTTRTAKSKGAIWILKLGISTEKSKWWNTNLAI